MNSTEWILTNRGFQDLNPILIGMEACEPAHSSGPAVRCYTLLHYVVSGKGIYQTRGQTYSVKSGEVFRILPGETCYYRADDNDPWTYRWLAFDGTLSKRFEALPPVFPVSAIAAQCFVMDDPENDMPEYRIASNLFRLYAEIFEPLDSKSTSYVRRARDYVDATYMLSELRVEEIANRLHLDRRYLSRIFKEKTGESLQEYIVSTRMAVAQKALSEGLSVASAAERCGYTDVFLFSKMFKRRFGVSPANWKKQNVIGS